MGHAIPFGKQAKMIHPRYRFFLSVGEWKKITLMGKSRGKIGIATVWFSGRSAGTVITPEMTRDGDTQRMMGG
jgi:hypothetical protein